MNLIKKVQTPGAALQAEAPAPPNAPVYVADAPGSVSAVVSGWKWPSTQLAELGFESVEAAFELVEFGAEIVEVLFKLSDAGGRRGGGVR